MKPKPNLDRFVETMEARNAQRPFMDERAVLAAANGGDMAEREFCILLVYLGGASPQHIVEMDEEGFNPSLVYKGAEYKLNMDIGYCGTPQVSYPKQDHDGWKDFESGISTSV